MRRSELSEVDRCLLVGARLVRHEAACDSVADTWCLDGEVTDGSPLPAVCDQPLLQLGCRWDPRQGPSRGLALEAGGGSAVRS